MTIEEGDFTPLSELPGKGEIEKIVLDECFMLLGKKSVGRLVIVVADERDVFTVD